MDGIAGIKDFSLTATAFTSRPPLFGDNGMQRVLSTGELKKIYGAVGTSLSESDRGRGE